MIAQTEDDRPTDHDLEVIRVFVANVNARAETSIALTGRVEGAHYNAMRAELATLEHKASGLNA